MPSHVVSKEKFPRVFGWMSRFQRAVDASASIAPKPRAISGDEAASYVESFKDEEDTTAQEVVNGDDPQDFAQGTLVEVYPADWGSSHRDSGRLVALAPDEVTIKVEGAMSLRIHAPRTGFRVTAVGGLR
jgi:hypothetical protein